MNHSELILERFCGREIFPIEKAEWNLYFDAARNCFNFCLSIYAGSGTTLSEDTQTLNAMPRWEINILAEKDAEPELSEGTQFLVNYGYDETTDEYVANFYYCAHEVTDQNVVQILVVDGDRLKIRMVGETIDVNYYDGSKPPTKIQIETWFERNKKIVRSVS